MWPLGDLLVTATCFVIGLTITHFWLYRWRVPKCNSRLPPGSMGLPLIGETLQLYSRSKSIDIHPFIKNRIQKYGKIFKTSLAGHPVVVSSNPEFNDYLLKQEGRLVEIWYMDTFGKIADPNGRGGPMTSVSHIHKVVRSMAMSQVGGLALQERIFPSIEEVSRKTLSGWCDRESVDVSKETTSMLFEFSAKILFGLEPDKNMLGMFACLTEGLMSLPLNIPGFAYNKCLKNHKMGLKLMKDLLDERRLNPEKHKGDLIDQIIHFMKTENFLTEDFAVSSMYLLLFASFASISTGLTTAIMHICEHPMVLKQLQEEHAEIIGKRETREDRVTWTEYKSMKYTMQVINESLRMANTASFILRRAIKDIHYNGYTIPEGWTVMISPEAVHLNPEIFKDPLSFNPGRWKDSDLTVADKIFTPFGGGGRMCAGAEYTKALTAVFIHILVSNYRFQKVKGGEFTRSPLIGFGEGFYIKMQSKGTA